MVDEQLNQSLVYTDVDSWCEVDGTNTDQGHRWILRLRSNGLLAPFARRVTTKPVDLKVRLAVTKSVLNNITRIVFSLHSSTRQLLIGPPGIGKTKIIEALAMLLGYDIVRINLSSNTTFDDLIGSFVPRVVAGQRSLEFQAGPLYQALKNDRHNTVILFDELNLARRERLDQLTPLFANADRLFIPA